MTILMRLNKIIISISSVGFIVFIWYVLTTFEIVNPIFIPSPQNTLQSLIKILKSNQTLTDLFFTTYRALIGLLISIIIGVPSGLILGRFQKIYAFFEVPIEFFRAIPSSALFPLFILFFGIGDSSKVAVVVYACSLIILVNTIYGVSPNQEKLDRINMLKSFGANTFQLYYYGIFRDALPNIFAGIRICISFSFVLVVVTEMFLSANEGLGKALYDYYLQYRIPEMYSIILLLGFTGFIFNRTFVAFESKIIFWAKRNS
jgi:ABC-type nitrate/sulfonate/bicarbonate transport system permease component